MKLLANTKVHLLLITILTITVYLNTLGNQFVWDDKTFANWELTKSFKYLPELLKGVLPPPHEGDFRPLKGVILLADYKLFANNPFWYHLQAIVIHLAATLLFYLLTRKIFARVLDVGQAGLIAAVTALLFGVHPVHTEAITFVTSSTDIVGVIFFVLAFYFYIKAVSQYRDRGKFLFISLMFGLLAYFAYEATLVLLPLLVLYDLCFGQKLGKVFLTQFPKYGLYFGTIVFYGILRFWILRVNPENSWPEGNFFLTMITMVKAFLKYVGLTVFPVQLSINHQIPEGISALFYVDYNRLAFLSQKLTDWPFLFSFGVLVVLILVGIFFYRRLPLFTFAIFWFFISLVPFANILPLNNFMSERYLYLASYGWCLSLAFAIYYLFNLHFRFSKYLKITTVSFLVAILTFYSARTVLRNLDWRDSETLWSKTLARTPESVLANHNLGNVYAELGKLDRAIEYYQKAAANNSKKVARVNLNFGYALAKTGQANLAIIQFKKAAESDPQNYYAHFALGNAYSEIGKYDLAIDSYRKAIALWPAYFEAYIKLGIALAEKQNLGLAIEQFEKAAQLKPDSELPFLNLAVAYFKQDRLDLAGEAYQEVLKINPNNETAKQQLQKIQMIKNIGKQIKRS